MSTPELVFAAIGGTGLALLLGTLLLGSIGGDAGMDADVDVDADSGDGIPWLPPLPVLFAGMVGIGLGGYLSLTLNVPFWAACICALAGCGLIGAMVNFVILQPMIKQQHDATVGRASYGGRPAIVSLHIPASHGFGEVRLTDNNNAFVTERAWSHDGQEHHHGDPVVIVEVMGDGVRVASRPTSP